MPCAAAPAADGDAQADFAAFASLAAKRAGAGSAAGWAAAQARHAPGTMGASSVSRAVVVTTVLEVLLRRLVANIKRHIVCLSSLSIGGGSA